MQIKARVKKHPVHAHIIKHTDTFESNIIFFNITASVPVKINATILKRISFRLKSLKGNPSSRVSKINLLPKMIK